MYKSRYEIPRLFALIVGLFGCIAGLAASPLPKGNCAAPQPYTDLRHCRFNGTDLKNKDLQGADLRGIMFYKTQLQGANLTNALVDGRYITYGVLDGVIGLPVEALEIIKNSYLVVPNGDDLSISKLPSGYKGGNENIAGLDNIFLAQKVPETHSTLALLAYPKYGDSQKSAIFARFDDNKFDFPTCYQSVNLLSSDRYYYPHWSSMKVKLLTNGDYLIGVRASGSDGDEMGMGGWDMVAFLKLSSTCGLSLLNKEDSSWAEEPGHTRCRGSHLEYHLLDERTAEIQTTEHICGQPTESKVKTSYKKINLNLKSGQ